ncbi:MAG: hypothetical protein QXX17_00535 [Conexivisphaerales archaeon]
MSEQNKDESVRLLLNPNLALRKRPWDLNIQLLLERFLEFLQEKPVADMRLSGLALLTSSLIYKLKVEHLFYEEERSAKKRVSELVEPVEVLRMPFRLQPPASDISDLLAALQSLLTEMERAQEVREKNPFQPGLEQQVIERESITSLIEEYSYTILERLKQSQQLSLRSLFEGKDWKEIVRIFMTVLYLAHNQKVVVTQDEASEEIYLVSVG